jgi:hypothetical protein
MEFLTERRRFLPGIYAERVLDAAEEESLSIRL